MLLQTLAAMAAGALALEPATVPAHGNQQAILKLDAAAMVRVTAENPQGTACTLVDHLRGPFASSGQAGSASCDLDVLLDAGTYKVRLASPPKGKGAVALRAAAFKEVNAPLVRLERGRSVEQVLRSGEQASFWIRVERREFHALRVAGRTAGAVRLWRSGKWAEPFAGDDAPVSPGAGQPIHEWRLEQFFEAGDYLLTVYGSAPRTWTRGTPDDLLTVSLDAPRFPEDRRVAATLPAAGALRWEVASEAGLVAWLALTDKAVGAELVGTAVSDDGSMSSRYGSTCRIGAAAVLPECGVSGVGGKRQVLEVRGPPGTGFELQWAAYTGSGAVQDHSYSSVTRQLSFRAPASGDFLVSTDDLPADRDSAPLACALYHDKYGAERPRFVARDEVRLPEDRKLALEFNYPGEEQVIAFGLEDSGTYVIETSGERGTRCELFKLGSEYKRVSETQPDAEKGRCRIALSLGAGSYDLKLYGGNRGIEKVSIAPKRAQALQQISGIKSACVFGKMRLEAGELYHLEFNRTGAVAARGLFLRPLPLALESPLSVELRPGEPLRLPLGAGSPVVIRAVGGEISCDTSSASFASKGGACSLPKTRAGEVVTLSTAGAAPVRVSLFRPKPQPALPPLLAFSPSFAPVPALDPNQVRWLDFERGEAHSFAFEVRDAGLYHLTTEGLLSTECQVRTPAVPLLTASTGGGRGRNCLVATYLNPGSYLATVRAQGASRGRAGLVLTRRSPVSAPPVDEDGRAFFDVPAGELVQQKLTVKKAGKFRLATYAPRAAPSCRFEDSEGWPLRPVPGPCELNEDLDAGTYLWTQLPLTVASTRRTRLERQRPEIVLRGNKAHSLELNRSYAVELGKDGKDEFVFQLEADLDVRIFLGNGMQGRLYRVRADKSLEPVEFIEAQQQGLEDSAPSEQPPYEPQEYVQEETGEGGGEEGYSEDGQSEPAPLVYQPPPPAPPPAASGKLVSLTTGTYRLVAQHSRADVAVSYAIQVSTEVLAPGVARELTVPQSLPLRVGRDGTLELTTDGDVDVRCRVFDAAGRIVAESSGEGDDWNCAMSAPVPAGEYRLRLESETGVAGVTRVRVRMPPTEDAGVLVEGWKRTLAGRALVAAIPGAAPDVVQQVSLASGRPFSCALIGAKGEVLQHRSAVKDCSFLVRGGPEALRVRLWTVKNAATVDASVERRPIVASTGASLEPGRAARVAVARSGRYHTSAGIFCLPDAESGLLRECGPEVSLERGAVVFAALGSARLQLTELVARADGKPEKIAVGPLPYLSVQEGAASSLQLVHVRGGTAERGAPVCELEGGTRLLRERDCFAATGVRAQALARVWSAEPQTAELVRLAVALPSSSGALPVGKRALTSGDKVSRWSLPKHPARLDLTLAPETWAIALDAGGRATDLCAPQSEGLSRCVLFASGGELVLFARGEHRAELELVAGEAPARITLDGGLFEALPHGPGALRIVIPPAAEPRVLEVEGARSCAVLLSDGSGSGICRAAIEAGLGAELAIEHDGGALRAIALPTSKRKSGMFPAISSAAPPRLAPAQAEPLGGKLFDRAIALDAPALVHVRSDSGVCALVTGDRFQAVEGLQGGCELHRLLGAGQHRLLVRPFAGQPLSGTVAWLTSAVEELGEGVGKERWIAPGEVKQFRFQTRSKGRVGLGIQVGAEVLSCAVLGEDQKPLGTGCQQLLALEPGSFLLEVSAPRASPPLRFRPVLVGLAGEKMGVPEEYLRGFFERVGGGR